MNGIINLKKEAGMTSHDAVLNCVRFWEPRKLVMVEPWIRMWWVFCRLRLARRHAWSSLCRTRVRSMREITLGYSTTTEDASGEVIAETLFCLPWMKSLLMKRLLA